MVLFSPPKGRARLRGFRPRAALLVAAAPAFTTDDPVPQLFFRALPDVSLFRRL